MSEIRIKSIAGLLVLFLILTLRTYSQAIDRDRPDEWNNLVFGGRFMDMFLPMPGAGDLTYDTWGSSNVVPRDVRNGIESKEFSFWGGNIVLGDDGRYHLLVCGWPENSPKGHATWPGSIVYHTTSENLYGPYEISDTIGKGHNPEVYRLRNGRYVLYVMNGYYLADRIEGPWTYGKFEFHKRDRKIIEGLSNLSFARREDGSFLMVDRGGGIWFSQTGLSPYNQVTEERVYPAVEGKFEDPVVWCDNVQYNLIVNDWLGRIAYYLRSKDGVKWVVDPGEAYAPGISKYADGTVEDWFKYERIKVFQDQYGRAIMANFAVIDTLKKLDLGNDNHSSKNICIPLIVPRLLTLLNKKQITGTTKSIRVKISAEPGFDPHKDIDISSLRFGAPGVVNFGGGCEPLNNERSGNDLIVTFNGEGNGIDENEFAAKLLGKTSDGKLLMGYARLPWVEYAEPILSARLPEVTALNDGFNLKVEVQNFGQVASKPASLQIVYFRDEKQLEIGRGKIPKLAPYQMTNVNLTCDALFDKGAEYNIIVIINPDGDNPVKLHGKITPVK